MKKFLTLFLSLFIGLTMLNAQTVYWGEGATAAQGQFDGGLNGWTTTNTLEPANVWTWEPQGSVGSGALATDNLHINSSTFSNGAMTLNADFYSTGGDPNNLPEQPYPTYISELISPTINLSAATVAVSLEFHQLVRLLNEAIDGEPVTGFATSTDNGNTWSDWTDINPSLAANAPALDGAKSFPINGAGSSQFKVKFRFSGDFYFWAIDDVKIVARPSTDIRINTSWVAVAPYTKMPKTMVQDVNFMADIQNVGSLNQENVNLNVKVTKSGTQVYTNDYFYGDLQVDSTNENKIFDGSFIPSTEVGTYTVNYTLSSDSIDANNTNNLYSYTFGVTDKLFAKENITTSNADSYTIVSPADGSWSGGNHSWAVGNYFYVPTAGNELENVVFGINHDPAHNGKDLIIKVYEIAETSVDGSIDSDERILVGLTSFTIPSTPATGAKQYTIAVPDFNTNLPIQFKANTQYLVALEWIDDDTDNNFVFLFSTAVDYLPVSFLTNQLFTDGLIDSPRYITGLSISDDLNTDDFSTFGFSGSYIPYVRMNVRPTTVANHEIELPASTIAIYPNPVQSELNLNIKTGKDAQNSLLQIFDATGKLVQTEKVSFNQLLTKTLNVSNLPIGSYTIKFSSGNEFAKKQFNVVR
ncbi:MAG: T9SS type A sorting domain-containing protein [Saprospiraceae bacterium]|nr:T9SS type A sorting domain-containing protein [Saprospiraceae bacterium]